MQCFFLLRYQNQRHPSNKVAPKVNVKQTTGGEHVPGQGSSTGSGLTKREPLLPTPPSTLMVKLDTTLTCKKILMCYQQYALFHTEFSLGPPPQENQTEIDSF